MIAMPTQELDAVYNRFMTLMDRATNAIDRRDLGETGLLEQQVESLTSELKARFLSSIADCSTPEAVATLKNLLQQALDRVTQNQNRLAGWIAGTGAELLRLQQGAVAVRGYQPLSPSNLPLFEQRA
jgi:hypothetical protein